MRKLMLATAIAAVSSMANAEDFDWSGYYAGLLAGYNWADAASSLNEDGLLYWNEFSPRAAAFGLFAGWQRQLPSGFVLGVDVYGSYRNADDNGELSGNFPTFVEQTEIGIGWSASARMRAGYAFGRWLPYIAAGASLSAYDLSETKITKLFDQSGTQTFSDGGSAVGWTVGLGSDYALGNRWFLRTEYSFTDFGSDESDLPAKLYYNNTPLKERLSMQRHDLVLGIGYRF